MAEVSDLTVRIRAQDELSPVLGRIRRDLWLLAHPRAALALIAGGWGVAGLFGGVLLTLALGGS